MILKIQTKQYGWHYIDHVGRCDVSSPAVILKNSAGAFVVANADEPSQEVMDGLPSVGEFEQFCVDYIYDYHSKDGKPELTECRVGRVHLTLDSGEHIALIFGGQAFLMGDDGKTIEHLLA